MRHGGVRLSADGLAEAAPKVFKNAPVGKEYLKRNKHIQGRLKSPEYWQSFGERQIVKLRTSQPYAREELALVDARTLEDAKRMAEALWGPLRMCRPA